MPQGHEKTESADPHTRFWEKISLIAEISALSRRPNPSGEKYMQVLRLIQNIIPFEAATLYLRDSQQNRMVVHTCIGAALRPPGLSRPSDWKNLGHGIIDIREPLLCSSPVPASDSTAIETLSTPLMVEDDVIGYLVFGSFISGMLRENHVKLVSIIADQLAVSIERLNYERMIEKQNEELNKAHAELKASQEQLVIAEKLRVVSELAASINHEINNPLSVIVGHLQCLQLENQNLSEKLKERLERIEQAAERICDVNRKLLTIDSVSSEDYLEAIEGRMLKLGKSTGKARSHG